MGVERATKEERREVKKKRVPHPPGNSDDYQNTGIAGEAIRMNVKRKELRI
jgi:hypothetical protein